MTTYVFNSTDTGAPSRTGIAGADITFWDALLVNGYNSKSGVTITRTGSVATATYTAHGYVNGQVLEIAGAGQSEYNGQYLIYNVTANTFDFTVSGTPATPATGTITSKVAGAGWTKPFTGAQKAGYLAPGGGFYIRIDDSGTTSSRITAYKTMSDVDTGTEQTPTTALFSGGLYLCKSSTADATARPWSVVIRNGGKTVYGRVQRTSVAASSNLFNFGEFLSRRPGDSYNINVCCSASATASSDAGDNSLGNASTVVSAGHFIMRSYTQLGGPIQAFRVGDGLIFPGVFGVAGFAFPNVVDGNVDMVLPRIMESTTVHRGWAAGAYMPSHNKPLSDLSTFEGSGAFTGRTFVVWNFGVGGQGQIFIETTQ